MSATVLAIAKKLAVMLATDKRTWKVVGVIVGMLLFIALMPAIVLLSMGNSLSSETAKTSDFGTMYVQNLTPEQQQKFSQIESDGKAIADELTALNLKKETVKAQVIYMTYFDDVKKDENFFRNYCACFKNASDDSNLINMLNSKYGTNINYEEYMRTISVIENISIDKNLFVNLAVKNNIDLANWAQNAFETQWGYVPYADGNVLTKQFYEALKEKYADKISSDCDKWVSRRACDNYNLLKSYLWYDSESRTISADNYAISDMTVQELYASAKKKGNLDTIPNTVGIAVINGDTIGIYVGNVEVVYAKSVADGVIKEKVSDRQWSSWFEIPWITYGDESSFNNEINFSDCYDPTVKNNIDLVKWAENACKSGWGYVYGTYGNVLTESLLRDRASVFGAKVTDYMSFIRQNWLGKRTADCVGLIKGYGWYDYKTGEIVVGSNGMTDVDADRMFNAATVKGTIDTIPEVPGLAVWQEGHIGIYIGNGEVIEAMNTERGVVKTKLAGRDWTHWLQILYISYVKKEK